MSDTDVLEDTLDEGDQTADAPKGFEVSGDERKLVETLREKNLSAGAVTGKITEALDKQGGNATATTSKGDPNLDQPATVRQVQQVAKDVKEAENRQASAAVRDSLNRSVGLLMDKEGWIGGDDEKLRGEIVEETINTLTSNPATAKMTDAEFHKAVAATSAKVIVDRKKIAEVRADRLRGKEEPAPESAAAAHGEREDGGPPPRSSAETPRRSESDLDPDDLPFGIRSNAWAITDQELEAQTSREAKRFLKKAGAS